MKLPFNTTTILAFMTTILLASAISLYIKVNYLLNNSSTETNTTFFIDGHPYATASPTLTPEEIKREIIKLINEERTKNGFTPLKENPLLNRSAELKAKDMLEKDYWEHDSPQGTKPWYFFQRVGYVYREAGENLARDFYNPKRVVESWMNSPTHRDNILTPRFDEIGIGIAYASYSNSSYSLSDPVIVAHFGSKRKTYTGQNGVGSNQTPSRTGKIVPYHDWCNNKNITVYENEIIVKRSSDGNVYGMTIDDWECYENYLKNR